MLVISSREFRDNQAKYLDKVDDGEQIIVQRGKNKAYKLTPVDEEDVYFTPEMLERIRKSIEQAKQGKVKSVSNKKELLDLLDSL
jgi:prevent-host-death family protein